ncbi:hypothetical protein J2Z22_000720 [Paenibacillus forsythiae]|uniref:Uncharacterized protein n=1 Tax=Paenibacillus forsythiae TaxID=365616 RepID=A0ABU3H566_9BACL|nr:hypothetical protein [Paenibacillus forsythiae]MDT3425207.1 hypothetical protein [Paenibacillus forsythiae]
MIIQDTVEDLCFLCVDKKISTVKEVRQFFKFIPSASSSAEGEAVMTLESANFLGHWSEKAVYPKAFGDTGLSFFKDGTGFHVVVTPYAD